MKPGVAATGADEAAVGVAATVVLLLAALAACTDDDASAPTATADPSSPTATVGTEDDGTPVPARLEPPVNPYLADSTWLMAHQGPAQQACSSLPGPEGGDVDVLLVDFRSDAGIERVAAQTAPFLVLSGRDDPDEPEGRAVWGASLTDLYKYALVDGQALPARPDLSGWADCVFVSSTQVTNNVAIEPLDGGGSAMYLAAAGSMVKVVWDPDTGTLGRRWERPVPVRSRTGTTPTLVGYGDDELVAIVDAPCAVTDPFDVLLRDEPFDRAALAALPTPSAGDDVALVDEETR